MTICVAVGAVARGLAIRGEYTTLEIALVVEAWRTGANINVASKLPWLGQTVTQHVHALLPDEQSVYDGGTWGEHPARPSALALTALSLALTGVDDTLAAQARWMTAHALTPLKREQAWLGLLADRAGAPERSPRGAATSLHLAGQGLTFVRSDWSHAAVWASFHAGPRLAVDHQDADQGHFRAISRLGWPARRQRRLGGLGHHQPQLPARRRRRSESELSAQSRRLGHKSEDHTLR